MQCDDLFMTDPVIASNGLMEGATLHIEDLVATFVTYNCRD